MLTLGPLPVRPRALLAAKVAAGASALGLTVAALNCFAAFAWPLVLAPAGAGLIGTIRFVAAFWIALAASGAFLYSMILAVQAVAAQLPRRWSLRASGLLQIGLFAVFLGGLCFQPDWLPTYWFTGLLCDLSGHYSSSETAPLARKAVIGLAAAMAAAGGAFLLSYLRTLRKIVEEPDAAPGRRGGIPLPRLGRGPQTAIAHFVMRTLMRSRQHRVILSFYLGGGFALAAFYLAIMRDVMRLTGEDLLHRMNTPMLVASIILLCAAWLGPRTVFALPVELRANWLFRVTPAPDGRSTRTATRRALLAVSAMPVTAISTVLLWWFWPWTAAVGHAFVLGLTGCILVDLSLRDFRKIPFTCSYLPGKSKAHMVFWFAIIPAIFAIHKAGRSGDAEHGESVGLRRNGAGDWRDCPGGSAVGHAGRRDSVRRNVAGRTGRVGSRRAVIRRRRRSRLR